MKAMLIILVLLTGSVMAQEPEHMAAASAAAEQQTQSNTDRLDAQEKSGGETNTKLNLLGVGLAIAMLLMQRHLAKQVNGMKDQLVEEVRKAATLQGAKTERLSHGGKRKPRKKVAKARNS